ncbi:hypothetical protein [Paenibacillus sacheonensis]|uniref:Uncharacterized protein n=1 Tax=Paenibacillus sacheonensis TaxID=742054 RepID=A0A7X4YUA9_9BACL|nr:hypothetical protein [Paenibacillus sacheonensis]MBM7569113.1 uncharacterized protein YxjI [Paenibacillus sacheonensis]NBC72713.1 hypothetical protein [Paenibacillus sacheonensis]
MKLYFRDNFFNAGQTEILNEENQRVGEVDLRSMFGSGLDIYDGNGNPVYSGSFPLLSNKWSITEPSGEEVGVLRAQMSFFSKKYEYEAFERGVYELLSPAFSQEYEITDENGALAASFAKVSSWFDSSAYCLDNFTRSVDSYEWITVILGMHEIQKRQR